MDTFPNIGAPDWGFDSDTEAKVIRSQFGDGYELRTPDGLNHLRESWGPTWSSLDPTEAGMAYNWLRARLQWKAFLWYHPTKKTNVKVVCESVSLNDAEFGRSALSAKFREDHNPA